MDKRLKKNKFKNSINRIVIGDVGSGKTIVAFITALVYLESLKSGSVAILAPTEVLAFQHYQKLLEYKDIWTDDFLNQIDYIFISGKQYFYNGEKTTKKNLAKQKTKKCQFYIGTHALLHNEEIKPDLILIDEQHRFGVNQRQKLTKNYHENQGISPHFLSFSATPIPRTLALTIYKSLQPYFLEPLSDKKPIQTSIDIFDNISQNIVTQIESELKKQRKVYIICAKVEDSEETEDIWSIKKTEAFFSKYFPGQILSVHGKIKTKKDILTEFKNSEKNNILVATTVVEVGVDVPEASLIVILNAERFGLSALHQIRGRVGRNQYPDNKCILITQNEFRQSKRLRYLTKYQNGFDIAQKDLELRGSGDLLGTSQSGFDDEINELLGLDSELYYKINQLVESTDFENLNNNLPRLENFLKSQSQNIWNE